MPAWWTILALSCLALAPAARAQDASSPDAEGSGRIDGRVLDASGWPLPGARIHARKLTTDDSVPGGSEPLLETSSDADGRFAFQPLAPGTYQVDIEAPGHQTARVGVHLPEARVSVAPFEVNLRPLTGETSPGFDARAPEPAPPSVRRTTASDDAALSAPAAATVAAGVVPRRGEDVTRALEAGQIHHARSLLAGLEERRAGDADLFCAVGEALLRAGETEDAVATLDEALARDPSHVEARYRRALGLLGLGRYDEAREDFARVLELRPTGPLADGARTALTALGRSTGPP